MPHRSFESFSPRPTETEIDAQEKLDNAVFAFEDRLHTNLDAAEMSGDGLYPWGEYVRRSDELLKKTVPEQDHKNVTLTPKNLLVALAARDALAADPDYHEAILAKFKKGHTGNFGDRILIALSAYQELATLLDQKQSAIEAAKAAAFHDWHDAVDFDNLKLPRREMMHPKKPQVDDLFKYDQLIDQVVDAFVLHEWKVPTTPDNKLDLESLMNRAYQENLIPEATYQKFENDMAGYFEDELNKKNTTKKQL